MSLVTRCTSCGTLFRVVADQLKISDGWVRCGQCATVFDAQAHLVQDAASVSAPLPQQEAAGHTQEPVASTLPPPAATQDLKPEQPKSDSGSRPAQPEAEEDIRLEIESFRSSKFKDSGMLSTLSAPSADDVRRLPHLPLPHSDEVASQSEEPTTFFPASALRDSVPPESFIQPAFSGDVGTDASVAAPPSFVVQAERAKRWRSPWVRLGLSLLCLGLLAALAAQIAVHEKDRIAAQQPQAKPWLDRLCQYAGCQVQSLKRIEAITVDASSFNRINKNNAQLEATTQSYRLTVTLKNAGSLPVALPHVELSLQDAQDQPILRRVLSPADLGAKELSLSPSQDLPGSIIIQVDTAQLAGNRISGYRVLAFYP